MAALQNEHADGKQEQEDKNGVEFVAEESMDHERFSLSLVWFCSFHDPRGGQERRLNLFRDLTPPAKTSNHNVPACVNEHTEPASV
jgi:hypothetical protein